MDGNGSLFATSLRVLTAPKLEDAGIYFHFIFNVHYYMLTTYQQLPVFLVPSLNPNGNGEFSQPGFSEPQMANQTGGFQV